ncbi:MAG: hypothetical protein JO061_21550 [Acidobacteriaceae bacterium]|nr:hypothetical protein [Acidobacteriaceae bacterium]
MKRLLARSIVGVAIFVASLYAGDYLSLKLQIPRRAQFGTVHVQPYLAVPRKDGKTEFMLQDPVDQPCVHSLFPHFGDPPCWYVQRHRSRRINL